MADNVNTNGIPTENGEKTVLVTIVGKPNVGKSTLMNAILGEKVAIVSKKPQTTRNTITGILTEGDTQCVFIDTPGVHKPRTALGRTMVKNAMRSLSDVDVIIFVTEPSQNINPAEEKLLESFGTAKLPVILAVNKTDCHKAHEIAETIKLYSERYDFEAVVPISAKNNDNVGIVLDEARKFAYESGWRFPEDIATSQPERQIASEIIREKLLRLLDDEVPHGTAVIIEIFEDSGRLLKIAANIYCEKEGHKRIIIGSKGEMIKKIGQYAREDMEEFFGCKVYLDLWVKVKENWRESELEVNRFGYKPDDKD